MKAKNIARTADFETSVNAFRFALFDASTRGYLATHYKGAAFNTLDENRQLLCLDACKVKITYGKAYVRVDIGGSGRYMVDADGNIFGIKAYGVIHRGHQYGTLATTAEWDWSGYTAHRRAEDPAPLFLSPVEAIFERNQADPARPDAKIIWAGQSVLVFLPASPELREPDEVFSAEPGVVQKIQAFCAANDCRCTQIVNGKIQL